MNRERVPSYSMWEPRRPSATLPACSWKVTARFDARLADGRIVEMVRVHGFFGLGIVLHFEIPLFLKTFRRSDSEEARPVQYSGNVRMAEGRRGWGLPEAIARRIPDDDRDRKRKR